MANWPITLVADYANFRRKLLGHDKAVSSFGDHSLIGLDAITFDLDQFAIAEAGFDRLERSLVTFDYRNKRRTRRIFCHACRWHDQPILSLVGDDTDLYELSCPHA